MFMQMWTLISHQDFGICAYFLSQRSKQMANIRRSPGHIKEQRSILNPRLLLKTRLPLEKKQVLGLPPSHRCVQMLQARPQCRIRLVASSGPFLGVTCYIFTLHWLQALLPRARIHTHTHTDVSSSFYRPCWPREEYSVLSALLLILKMNRSISDGGERAALSEVNRDEGVSFLCVSFCWSL